jgi:hypothetical protein
MESSEMTTFVRFARIAIGNTEADKTNAAILAAVKQLG